MFVVANKDKYRVKAMCRVLNISESGYYRWFKNRAKPTARELLSGEIRTILDEHPDNDNYGVKRMNTALEQKGIHVSLRTVYRTMSEMGILQHKRTPRGIIKDKSEIQESEKMIKREFTEERKIKKLI